MTSLNLIISLPFLYLYIKKNENIEIFIAILLLIGALVRVVFQSNNIVDYSIMISYAYTLILKKTKLKPMFVFLIGLSLFLFVSITLMNNGNIARVVNNIMLVTVASISHIVIYYNEYKETPDIKKLYNLTKLDMIILDSLFLPDPCLKTMQNYVLKKDIHCSKTYVKDRLQQFYDIFDIKSGGSRKTELVVRLVRLGYTP